MDNKREFFEFPGGQTLNAPDLMFSHDVTAAILVFQNNERVAMLVYQTNPVGTELFAYCLVSYREVLGRVRTFAKKKNKHGVRHQVALKLYLKIL